MDDKTSPRTEAQTEPRAKAPRREAEALELLSAMRARLDEAATDLERMAAELGERTKALDELESVTDAVLGVTDAALVVVGPDRRVRALSRGAADLLGLADGGAIVGRPLSAALPDDAMAALRRPLDGLLAAEEGADAAAGFTAGATSTAAAAVGEAGAGGAESVATGKWTIDVEPLGGGGAMLVVRDA